jgi:hypothetical protein
LPLGPQMKSKKNGAKENVGKWLYFWMKIELKKRHHNAENILFLISFLFCFVLLLFS